LASRFYAAQYLNPQQHAETNVVCICRKVDIGHTHGLEVPATAVVSSRAIAVEWNGAAIASAITETATAMMCLSTRISQLVPWNFDRQVDILRRSNTSQQRFARVHFRLLGSKVSQLRKLLTRPSRNEPLNTRF
jgi:hypothetical protein